MNECVERPATEGVLPYATSARPYLFRRRGTEKVSPVREICMIYPGPRSFPSNALDKEEEKAARPTAFCNTLRP